MKLKDYRKKFLRTVLFKLMATGVLRTAFFVWDNGMRFLDVDYPDLPDEGIIYIGWHENMFASMLRIQHEIKKRNYKQRNCDVYALSSGHSDAEVFIGVYRRYGINAVYGSSRRGGTAALIELISLIKNGNSTIITPDGPRGPRHELKEGAAYLAIKTGAPIVPLGMAVSKAVYMRSWDKMMLPKLKWRNEMHVVWGKPIFAPKNITPQNRADVLQQLCKQAQQELDDCTKRAEQLRDKKNAQSNIKDKKAS